VSEILPTKPLNLRLLYGNILVAELRDAFPHQGTWFANYEQIVLPEEGMLQNRLCGYIGFCEDWHQRLEAGKDPDPKEFDQYADVIESSSWRVDCPDGSSLTMDSGPIFVQGEASWNHPEVGPSTELEAERVWRRLTDHAS
jgi:hypothetical protein